MLNPRIGNVSALSISVEYDSKRATYTARHLTGKFCSQIGEGDSFYTAIDDLEIKIEASLQIDFKTVGSAKDSSIRPSILDSDRSV